MFVRFDPCFAGEVTRSVALMHCEGANIPRVEMVPVRETMYGLC
jgi:hypothetical protein